VKCDAVDYIDGFDPTATSLIFDGNTETRWRMYVDETLFRKNANWEGEAEYRVRVSDWTEEHCQLPLCRLVVGLALGPVFPPHQILLAKAVATAFGVEDSTAKMILNDGGVLTAYPAHRAGVWRSWSDQESRDGDMFE